MRIEAKDVLFCFFAAISRTLDDVGHSVVPDSLRPHGL